MGRRLEKSNFVLWLLGPTSCGKTTLAENLMDRLRKNGEKVIHFDGDEIRNFFGPSLGFEKEDRRRVIDTLVHVVNKCIDAGLNVVVSALTANEDARQFIRQTIERLYTVSIECSIDECIFRDPKGLYKKAMNKEIGTLVGYNSVYPKPESPDHTIKTENRRITDCVNDLEQFYNTCKIN